MDKIAESRILNAIAVSGIFEHSTEIAALMAILHCITGFAAALLARKQGRPFGPWLFWGLVGGTVALIAVLATPKRII